MFNNQSAALLLLFLPILLGIVIPQHKHIHFLLHDGRLRIAQLILLVNFAHQVIKGLLYVRSIICAYCKEFTLVFLFELINCRFKLLNLFL